MPNVVTNSNSQFYKTYQIYRNYVGYTKPLTYRQWLRLDDRLKVGALYCQFYNEITLAWYKVYTKWSIEEEGVECINQYLEKNVEKIKASKKRFDPRYIYKVAYNCLYCVCIDPSRNKDRYFAETSENFSSGEDELSWFDLVGDNVSLEDESISVKIQAAFESLPEWVDIVFGWKFEELTTFTACCRLKKLGRISGNTRNKVYCDMAMEILFEEALELFKENLANI